MIKTDADRKTLSTYVFMIYGQFCTGTHGLSVVDTMIEQLTLPLDLVAGVNLLLPPYTTHLLHIRVCRCYVITIIIRKFITRTYIDCTYNFHKQSYVRNCLFKFL